MNAPLNNERFISLLRSVFSVSSVIDELMIATIPSSYYPQGYFKNSSRSDKAPS